MTVKSRVFGRPRGEWVANTAYVKGDVVTLVGAVYVAKQSFTSTASFLASNWDQVLAASGSSVKSTVGAGLPTFANRVVGDLHFNTTTGKEYVLTGAGGGAFSDTFSNVVDNADLNGRTTESGGLTWSAANSTLHTGSGGYASGGSYGTYYGFVNMGPGNQTLQGVSGSQYGYGCINAPYAGMYGGYTLAGNNSQGRIYISLSRSNAAIGNTSVGGGPGAGTDDPYFFDGAPDQNIQWTLSRVGSLITATISNTAGANTRTLTYTDSDPLNGAWAGAWSSVSWIAFEMSGVSNGTLAWIPLTTDAAPLSQRLAGASVNTIGTSLPDFLGRASGDIHWDSVLKKEYILSGAAGGYWADSFNRANAATLGNTEIGGLAWFSSGAQILNNRVVGNPTTSGVTLRLNVGASTSSTQKFDINRAASAGGGSGWSAKFRCDSNGAGGYNVYVRTDQGSTNMLVIERNGVPVNGTHGQDQTPYPAAVPTVGAGMEEPVTATITVAEAAGSLTISVKFVRLSDGLVWDGGVLYTDTTPLANSAYVQLSNSGGDNGTGYIDNYGVQSNGTLKWNRTEIDPVPPTLRTVGASLITQGPGLPSVSDRLPNDLHYNSTLHKTSILTGTPGVLLTDSALGRTSLNPPSDGGGANTAWVNTTTATFLVDADGIYLSSQGFGNGAFGYEGFHIYRPVVTTDAAISADYRRGGASMGLYFAANDNSSIEVLMDTDGSVSLWRKTAPDGNGSTSNVDYVSPLVPGSNPIALSGTISATLSSAGVVTVVINGASYTGQLTPLSAITRVGVGMQNTGVNRFKNIMIPQAGSLAWTHIEPDTSTPTLRTLGASLITQGAGLPPFSGRIANDLHYDNTTGKTSILSGVSGGEVIDPFTYPDGSLAGKGSFSGHSWEAPGTYGVTGGGPVSVVVGNKLVNTDANQKGARIFVGSFGQGGSASARMQCNTSDGGYSYLGLGSNATNRACVFVNMQTALYFGQGAGTMLLRYLNPDGSTVELASIGGGQITQGCCLRSDVPIVVTLDVSATGVARVLFDGAVKLTGQLTPAQMATLGNYADISGGVTDIDDFSAVATGTLVWNFTEPIYLQAQLASGNVAVATHVLKPGIRVPTATNLREMILRCDTAPTGAPITVQVERFNNGTSAGVIGTASIPVGENVGSIVSLFAPCARGDILKFNITSVGSTVAGADLTASLGFF